MLRNYGRHKGMIDQNIFEKICLQFSCSKLKNGLHGSDEGNKLDVGDWNDPKYEIPESFTAKENVKTETETPGTNELS